MCRSSCPAHGAAACAACDAGNVLAHPAATLVGASMSSEWSSANRAELCIDGALTSTGLCHTNMIHHGGNAWDETNPWLSVELAAAATVASVEIWNRRNAY